MELAVRFHDTPVLDGSLLTVAVRTVTLPPAITLPLILFWITTAIVGGGGGEELLEELPPPHPVTNTAVRIAPARILRRTGILISP
jgi:hypothetical protein